MHSLGNMEYISTFCKGMHEAMQDQGVLSCALLPMSISGEVRSLMQIECTHDQTVQTSSDAGAGCT